MKLTPRVPRVVPSYWGELHQFLDGYLRDYGPSTARAAEKVKGEYV